MNMRHTLRNILLTANYFHPAVLGVTLRRGPRAVKHYLAEIYRCSKTDAGAYLPLVRLEDIIEASAEFAVVRPPRWDGSMTITEISSLCYLVAARRPRKILEIGTFQGLTTLNMAMNVSEAEVHSVDLPPDVHIGSTQFATADDAIISRRGKYYYTETPAAKRIHQHYGDTATFDFLGEIGNAVDFCLIDAAHSYEYVRNDTAKVLPLMKENGLVLWHDYGRNDFLASPKNIWGVTRFLHEIASVGVGILQGTSLGVLLLTASARQQLARHLSLHSEG